MRWKRLGHLFDPTEHHLTSGCVSHARAPQPLELADRVRVFFCAQTQLVDGKCISVPHYCDLSKDLHSLLAVSSHQIIEPGRLGEFDEHGIFPLSIFRCEAKTWAYTTGWSRRTSTPVEMAIGLATAGPDAGSFAKHGMGGPIMTAHADESCMVGDACVRFLRGSYHMWYIFSQGWLKPESSGLVERTYRIAHATSSDGINWRRDAKYQIPADLGDECQAMPAVFEWNGCYQMVFCFRSAFDFRSNKSASYRLGYARSKDLSNWERDDRALGIERPVSGWDSEMMCYPGVTKIQDRIYLFYNGNNFGRNGFGAFLLED